MSAKSKLPAQTRPKKAPKVIYELFDIGEDPGQGHEPCMSWVWLDSTGKWISEAHENDGKSLDRLLTEGMQKFLGIEIVYLGDQVVDHHRRAQFFKDLVKEYNNG